MAFSLQKEGAISAIYAYLVIEETKKGRTDLILLSGNSYERMENL
jgi:hypothetical protein